MTSPFGGKPAPVWIRGGDAPIEVSGTVQADTTSDFLMKLRIGAGLQDGYFSDLILGLNRAVPGTLTDVWGGIGVMAFPSSGEQWEVVSTSANDAFGGTGANLVVVVYLDTSYDEAAEVVSMNGTTPVVLNATDSFRPIRAIVIQAGSSTFNEGTITVQASPGGAQRNIIEPEFGISLDGHYTVPNGKIGFILPSEINAGRNTGIESRLYRTFGDNATFGVAAFGNIFEDAHSSFMEIPLSLTAKTDLAIRALNTAGGTAFAFEFYELLIVDEGIL